jgi:hypothetical protein
MVEKLVEQAGGSIMAHSPQSAGATSTLGFPARPLAGSIAWQNPAIILFIICKNAIVFN